MSTRITELRALANAYGEKKISRRSLWKGAAALGLSASWIAALEKGALAGPAATWGERPSRAQDRATTFIVAVEGDIDTWDPGFTVGSATSQTMQQNNWDQLTQYQVVDGTTADGQPYRTVDTAQIVPMLCESWTWEENDMVFTLRDGATFSNGDPIDAEVIRLGYQRVFEATISAGLIGMGDQITDSSQFIARDPKTFVMSLKSKNAITPMNNVMHNTNAVNPGEMEANATAEDPWALDYFRQNLGIGNGPYMLESYLPGDTITLVANPSYYGEQPPFTTVILKIVTDPTQRAQLLLNGDVDFATLIPTRNVQEIAANPDIKVLSLPRNMVQMLELNGTIAPFDNKLVRQAFAYAVPYQLIVEQVYAGQAQEAKGLVPSGMPTHDPSSYPYATDYEKAKALLAEAGFPEGEGLPEITLSYRTGEAADEQIAILTQASLSQIGIDITIQPLAFAAFNEQEQGKQLQFWVDKWMSWVNDPYYHLFWLALSGSTSNYPGLNNPRVDEIINTYIMAEDGEERQNASREAQALINDECNYIYLAQPNFTVVTRADVDGYVYYNDELPRYYHFRRATS